MPSSDEEEEGEEEDSVAKGSDEEEEGEEEDGVAEGSDEEAEIDEEVVPEPVQIIAKAHIARQAMRQHPMLRGVFIDADIPDFKPAEIQATPINNLTHKHITHNIQTVH